MKVVTYNIHKGMDKNNKLTLDKIGRYLNVLNCNVICLQEVLYKQYIELKKIINMDGVFVANVKEKLYGICIFTNYKITFNEHILLTSKKTKRFFKCNYFKQRKNQYNKYSSWLRYRGKVYSN